MVPARRPSQPKPLDLFLVFARIGLTSFGGGLSGWLLREFVERRRWIGEDEFLSGLSISQALPGINVTNMAIWIGYRLAGPPGALAGISGIVGPPAVLIVGLASLIEALTRFPLTRWALDGAAAAAIGLSLSMGITVARRLPRRLRPVLVCAGTFAAIGIAHLPLIPVVAVLSVGSISAEWLDVAKGRRS